MKQALERIDYAHDVIKPKLLEIRALEKGEDVVVDGTVAEIGEGTDAAADPVDA